MIIAAHKSMQDLPSTFRNEYHKLLYSRTKLILVLGFIFNSIFSSTDPFFSRGNNLFFFELRMSINLIIVAAFLAVIFLKNRITPWLAEIVFFVGFSFAFGMFLMCLRTGGFESVYASGFIFTLLTIQAIVPWHPLYQIILWICLQGLYLAQGIFLGMENIVPSIFSYNWMIFSAGLLTSINAFMQYRELKNRTENLLRLESQKNELSRLNFQLKEAQAELVRSGTLSAIGELAAGMAHNINTYMSGADMALTLINEQMRDNKSGPLAKTALESVRNTKAIVSTLESFSQKNREHYRPTDMMTATEEVLRLLKLYPKTIDIHFTERHVLGKPVMCDAQQIKTSLLNLLRNSVQANAKNILIETREEAGEAVILISDDGSGISPDLTPHIFEPFFTTKDVGQGTGLGLWMVHKSVKEHGGRVTFRSKIGEGTTFEIRLPFTGPK